MFCDFLVNLLASAAWTAILIGVGWFWLIRGRRPMMRFFGVDVSRRLAIYWSRVQIIPGGSRGVGGVQRSFGGVAVPYSEAIQLSVYQRLFNYPVPGLADAPGPLRTLLLADVDLEASASPLDTSQPEIRGSLIAVGSPGYNTISVWIERELHPLGRFIRDNSAIEIRGVEQPFADPFHCFVQRVRIQDGPAMAFYVAGMTEIATQCAQHFLATRWATLQKRFGDRKTFCIVLKAHPTDYRRHEEVMERGES